MIIRKTVRQFTRINKSTECTERIKRETYWLLFIPVFTADTITASNF